ncbi:gustatory receptor for sugar taste 64f [Scaptodrosophila lebanonensis]|uniref:Gustatory receptor n=1 Tax=Drosophila lebanonensis TaxID=7225 RepID=A0A6J2TEL9_DROLE|nr:gustatory receptor for sugar taste 64f [Scaptodrosophila lebanonensis]
MKFLQKFDLKFRGLRNKGKSPLLRKLDLMHESSLKQTVKRNYSDYISRLEAEYEARNHRPKYLPRSTSEKFKYNGSFHEAVGKVFLVAQFFAMMPVKGISGPLPSELSFAWRNWRTLYCLLFILSTLTSIGFTSYKVFNGLITFNNIEPLIFRGCILLVCVNALMLAKKWPALMMYWYEVEQDLPQYQTQVEKSRMAYTIHMVMFVGMMLSLAEHLLSMISAISYSNYCHRTDDPIRNFLTTINDEIFYVFNYSVPLAMWGKIQNVYSTFIWNYMDIFVMIISVGLAANFRQLNDNLLKFKGMHMPPTYWSERRIQYRNLCTVCEKLDNAISLITMVSFSNNLYFICVQLLRSLNTMPTVTHAVYFYFSLMFLIGRTLAVSLYSASVNDESRRTLRYLRCVPKESWCPEVKRFTEEVNSDFVALTGMKFFNLTRKLVLSVAGTIVTYELVLIQFHEDTDLWDCDQSVYA